MPDFRHLQRVLAARYRAIFSIQYSTNMDNIIETFRGEYGDIPSARLNRYPTKSSFVYTSSDVHDHLWSLFRRGRKYGERFDWVLFRLAAYLLPVSPAWHYSEEDADVIAVLSGDLFRSIVLAGSRSNGIPVNKLIHEFGEHYWPIRTKRADREEGLAIRVFDQSLPRSLSRLLSEPAAGLVDVITGDPFTIKSTEAFDHQSTVKEVEAIRQRLNTLDPAIFACVQQNHDAARTKLSNLSRSKENAIGVDQQRRIDHILRCIGVHPVPHYRAVENTTRLYANHESFLSIKREVRDVLTTRFTKFDISAAQLRIAAAVWKIDLPDVVSRDPWRYLLKAVGSRPDNSKVKADIKSWMYAVIFGRKLGTAKQEASRLGLSVLLGDPTIEALFAQRGAYFESVKGGEVVFDAWGVRLSVEEDPSKSKHAQAKTITARVCQSYELRLLLPVFEYADANGLTVAALLHDGIFCAGDWTDHVDNVRDLVNKTSLELLGVPMPIKVELPAPQVVKLPQPMKLITVAGTATGPM